MKNLLGGGLIILCSLLMSSCYNDINEIGQISDEFYLRHKGADLPVWVRGNADANTFIIFLHGGPFDTAIEHAVNGEFEPLYDDYAMVFFDQRGAGYSHGHQNVNLNEDQFVEDVEVLLQLIQEKYSQAESIFLMGHSYGGYLGTAFLNKDNNQSNFKGWIELAGAHNNPLNWLASRSFSINYIEQNISELNNREEWDENLNTLYNTPEISNFEELLTINGIAFEVAAVLNSGKSTFEQPSWLYNASSPVGTDFSQHHLDKVQDMLVNGNQNPGMSRIIIPSLLIYGGEDPIVPVDLGQNGIDFLGTPIEDKFLVILQSSGHSLWEFERDIFFDEVKTFISMYE